MIAFDLTMCDFKFIPSAPLAGDYRGGKGRRQAGWEEAGSWQSEVGSGRVVTVSAFLTVGFIYHYFNNVRVSRSLSVKLCFSSSTRFGFGRMSRSDRGALAIIC